MATQTLAEAKKLINNQITAGIAQDIIDVNPFNQFIPFTGYTGQGLIYNREDTLGDIQMLSVGGTITAEAPDTRVQAVVQATKIIGNARVDNLVLATSSSAGVDEMAIAISSKAKSASRRFQDGMVNDDGVSPNLNSMHTLCDASQYTTASAGQALSFELLDELLQLVTAKDGQVDFIMMPARTMLAYRALARSVDFDTTDLITFGDGTSARIPFYNGVPIFRNDFMSVVETANGAALSGGALASVYAGCLDDGSGKVGFAAVHPSAVTAGIANQEIGQAETKDELVERVKMYVNFALFNRRGLARLTSINN